jgi:hypothetical protein
VSRFALVALVFAGAGLGTAACGSSGATSSTTATESALVQPPKLDLEGCQYLVDNSVPAGEPKGSKAPFAAFAPDPSAVDAIRHIKAHGGTGMVDGFTLPAGTVLFTGPSTHAPHAGVVQPGNSVLAADPILWTDRSGNDWLAFFLICGGNQLYWMSVDEVARQNPSVGAEIKSEIAKLRTAEPYTKTKMTSLLPVVIDGQHHLVWVASGIDFQPARGQYLDF